MYTDTLQRKMPHITLSDKVKLNMLNYLSKNRKIPIQYRSMEMSEYPALPQTMHHRWTVKTVPHVNRPRFIIIAFQTNRKNRRVENAAQFDHCSVSDIRVHLNSQIYPYNPSEVDLDNGTFAELYHNYSKIQSSYYNGLEPKNHFNINYGQFQDKPIFMRYSHNQTAFIHGI